MFSASLKVGTTTTVRTACERSPSRPARRRYRPARMASDSRLLRLDRIVGPFAEMVLAADLPLLPIGTAHRGGAVRAAARGDRAELHPLRRHGHRGLLPERWSPSPAAVLSPASWCRSRCRSSGEYPELIRSLGYAYIWERWPDTLPTGAHP